jgi:hypothetical protein
MRGVDPATTNAIIADLKNLENVHNINSVGALLRTPATPDAEKDSRSTPCD